MIVNGFIQTGDLHSGECRTLSDYLPRHKYVLQKIADIAELYKLMIVDTGDLFHAKNTKPEERFLIEWWLAYLESKKIHSIHIGGNHDHIAGELFQLEGYEYFNPCLTYTKVYTKVNTHAVGDIGFIVIPWGNYSKEDLQKIVYANLAKVADYKYKVVVMHECILGSISDTGKVIPKGTAIPDIPEITYWAIGDIHSHQPTNVPNGFYAGAPAQFTFGDKVEKGVICVDLDNPCNKPEFIRIHSKPLLTVPSVNDIGEDAYYRVVGDDFEEVMKANKHKSVVKAVWDKSEHEVISYQKVSIVDGLPEMLAEKGLDDTEQAEAIDWVKKTLKLKAS